MENKLLKLLYDEHVITEEQYQQVVRECEESGGRFETVLEELGILEEDRLLEFLSKKFRMPISTWENYTTDQELLALVPEQVAVKYTVFPHALERGKRQNKITLAISDPTNISAIDDISFMTGCVVKAEISSARAIHDAIRFYYRGEDITPEDIQSFSDTRRLRFSDEFKPCGIKELDALLPLLADSSELIEEETDALAGLDRDHPATKFLIDLLATAVERKVSEIHIEPGNYETHQIKFCVHGVFRPHTSIPEQLVRELVVRLRKILQRSEPVAFRKESLQWKGFFYTATVRRTITTVFVSLYPTPFGERILFKIRHGAVPFSVSDLGIEENSLKILNRILAKPQGLLLLISPPRHGKTTTLYAMLRRFQQAEMNIVSIEQSIETFIPGVHQIPMHQHFSYQNWYSLAAYHAPDLIAIDDIQQPQMMQLAFELASDCLVIACLTASNTAEGLGLFLSHYFPPTEKISQERLSFVLETINGVVTQRLLRTLCSHCKESVSISEQDRRLITWLTSEADASSPIMSSFHAGKGCHECLETGYKTQTGIFEVVKCDKQLKQFVLQHYPVTASQLRQYIERLPMISLKQQGLQKLREGVSSPEELQRIFCKRS